MKKYIKDITVGLEQVSELLNDAIVISNINNKIINISSNKNPPSSTISIARNNLENIAKRNNFHFNTTSLETYSTNNKYLAITLEESNGILEKIKNIIKFIIDKVVEYWNKIKNFFTKKVEKVEDKAKDAEAKTKEAFTNDKITELKLDMSKISQDDVSCLNDAKDIDKKYTEELDDITKQYKEYLKELNDKIDKIRKTNPGLEKIYTETMLKLSNETAELNNKIEQYSKQVRSELFKIVEPISKSQRNVEENKVLVNESTALAFYTELYTLLTLLKENGAFDEEEVTKTLEEIDKVLEQDKDLDSSSLKGLLLERAKLYVEYNKRILSLSFSLKNNIIELIDKIVDVFLKAVTLVKRESR